jgi:acyl carrier protein
VNAPVNAPVGQSVSQPVNLAISAATLHAMSRAQLFDWVAALLAGMFELDQAAMTLESDLYVDLDIDSIDAVDLAVKLTELTGQRLAPERFRTIHTIADIVDAIAGQVAEQAK